MPVEIVVFLFSITWGVVPFLFLWQKTKMDHAVAVLNAEKESLRKNLEQVSADLEKAKYVEVPAIAYQPDSEYAQRIQEYIRKQMEAAAGENDSDDPLLRNLSAAIRGVRTSKEPVNGSPR